MAFSMFAEARKKPSDGLSDEQRYEQRQLRWAARHELGKLLGMEVPVDGWLTAYAGHSKLDVVQLDDKIRARHPKEYQLDESLSEFLTRTYGERAQELARMLL